jgi:hypothetical protein
VNWFYNNIGSRIVLMLLGILISIVGLISPTTCVRGLAEVTIIAKRKGKL